MSLLTSRSFFSNRQKTVVMSFIFISTLVLSYPYQAKAVTALNSVAGSTTVTAQAVLPDDDLNNTSFISNNNSASQTFTAEVAGLLTTILLPLSASAETRQRLYRFNYGVLLQQVSPTQTLL